MNDTASSITPVNGVGSTPAPLLPCPLEGMVTPPVHEYIHRLENRIIVLEAEQKRFTNALLNAGEFLFKNPASKMMLMAFPKDMQEKLREFFDARK